MAAHERREAQPAGRPAPTLVDRPRERRGTDAVSGQHPPSGASTVLADLAWSALYLLGALAVTAGVALLLLHGWQWLVTGAWVATSVADVAGQWTGLDDLDRLLGAVPLWPILLFGGGLALYLTSRET